MGIAGERGKHYEDARDDRVSPCVVMNVKIQWRVPSVVGQWGRQSCLQPAFSRQDPLESGPQPRLAAPRLYLRMWLKFLE